MRFAKCRAEWRERIVVERFLETQPSICLTRKTNLKEKRLTRETIFPRKRFARQTN